MGSLDYLLRCSASLWNGYAMDEQRFPELIRNLYNIVAELEEMFTGRPFTPDGHMVGSLAECFAEYYYALNLLACSNPGHDARLDDCQVEIKATQTRTPTSSSLIIVCI